MLCSQNNDIQMVKYQAYAKINLGLSILGKRTDGYHEIATLMVPVSIADLVFVSLGDEGLKVCCPDLAEVSEQDNLAFKAATSLVSFGSGAPGFVISIRKTIPPGKGLGGGSSNAAATLLGIRDLWPGRNAPGHAILMHKAADIGSDVPFFIGTNSKPPLWEAALCTGRGELVHPLGGECYWLVLVIPDVRVSTREAYSKWDNMNPLSPLIITDKDRLLANRLDSRMDRLITAFSSKCPGTLGRSIFNDFEESVYSYHPSLSIIKEKLLSSGAFGAMLTGSGSAVYAICGSYEHAKEIKRRFLELDKGPTVSQVAIAMTGVMVR